MVQLFALFLTVSVLGAQLEAHASEQIVVMTQNQYLGADLPAVIGAPDFGAAVVAALQQVAANNFPERAGALAAEVAEWQPDLVGLQEVFDFQCDGKHGAPPFRDHLKDTLVALKALGAPYKVVARVRNLHVENAPIPFPGCATITITDRDVILARKDVAAKPVSFSTFAGFCQNPSLDGCNYQADVTADSPIGLIEIKRGFVGVDATVEGKDYRFVNTHLEVRSLDPTNPLFPAVQAAQAAELIRTLQFTTPEDRSVIVAGDINSSPEDAPSVVDQILIVPPYLQFTDYADDVWTLRRRRTPGFTCCQDEDLSNRRSLLTERIDMIFTTEPPKKAKARVLGAKRRDKTWPSRLWPSDHAAVVAELRFD